MPLWAPALRHQTSIPIEPIRAVQIGLVREACADRHEGPHEANLFDLQAKYAEVISEAEALGVIG